MSVRGPIITADWPAAGTKAWTFPVGGGGGRLIKLGGKLPVNLFVGGLTALAIASLCPCGASRLVRRVRSL